MVEVQSFYADDEIDLANYIESYANQNNLDIVHISAYAINDREDESEKAIVVFKKREPVKNLIREIRRTISPVWGDRDIYGHVECLGKYDVIDLIINYETLKEWKKDDNNIFYDNDYYHMSYDIKVINQDWFEVELISKKWRK